jgi:hypothetical protein
MGDFVAEMELAAEAAAGMAINIEQDKMAADEEAASIKILFDQLCESACARRLHGALISGVMCS